MSRTRTFAQAVNEGLREALRASPDVVCFGLGVDDPKGVFGTTLGLSAEFGPERVFDMPTSENAMTGVAIGAALAGLRPVMTHQRLDFFLLALDQLVNNAAKWHYMFGGQARVPIAIRLLLGRGWGQGPTHSQSLQSWFAHIPGLKVVMPTSAADAKGLLLSAIFDDDPVLVLEHRWLYNLTGEVPEGDVRVPLGRARVVREGSDLTLVALSYMTLEADRAAACLARQGVSVEVIDLRSIRPLDWDTVFASVRKTGRLLAADTSGPVCSVASEIVATVSCEQFAHLRCAPLRVTQPDCPTPTSPALTQGFYAGACELAVAAGRLLGRAVDTRELEPAPGTPHDVPGEWFKGPF